MPPGYRTPINLILEVLEAGQKTGEVRPMESHLAAALVFGAIIRVPFFKRSGLLKRDLRELVDEVTETVWKMVSA